MTDGPDVRALRHLLSVGANGHRPVRCHGCPFSRPTRPGGWPVGCSLLGLAEVDRDRPPCTAEDWGERAREDLARLEADNALFAALARDAREESSMYARGKAEGAAAEREACCKAVCPDCAAGRAVRLEGGVWYHQVRNWRCRADAIRRRAEEDGS